MNKVFKRIKSNKGRRGIDKSTTDELLEYLQEHGAETRQSMLEGSYTLKPVKKIEAPKK